MVDDAENKKRNELTEEEQEEVVRDTPVLRIILTMEEVLTIEKNLSYLLDNVGEELGREGALGIQEILEILANKPLMRYKGTMS